MSIYKGKTVEEAVELGLKELGLTRETAIITVIDEGAKGMLLFGGKKAEVNVEPKPSLTSSVINFLNGLFEKIKINVVVEAEEKDEKVYVNLISSDSSSLIGHRGETLDAIQTLAGAVLNINNEEYVRVVVDCENYREKRNATLESLAKKLAEKAVRTGRKVTLEPMNPFERRVIHSALSDNEQVKTESQGVEPNRYVVIIPNNLKPYSRNDKGGYKKGGKGRDNKPREKSEVIKLDKKTIGYGTYLGNTNKND